MFTTRQQVAESNRIERIDRPPSDAEVSKHREFLIQEVLTITTLMDFLSVYQPNARLREYEGMDVRVGKFKPPAGGDLVRTRLNHGLNLLMTMPWEPHQHRQVCWEFHQWYEALHPFTDGNGRTGRMIWYWMMWPNGDIRGFLHEYYYQTLQYSNAAPVLQEFMP